VVDREAGINLSGGLEPGKPAGQRQLCDAILASGISLDQLESMLLDEAVQRAQGNLAGAARSLGISRPQLSYRLKRNQNINTDDKA
jgi:transcriptional regulator with AAA-type ATPase domain